MQRVMVWGGVCQPLSDRPPMLAQLLVALPPVRQMRARLERLAAALATSERRLEARLAEIRAAEARRPAAPLAGTSLARERPARRQASVPPNPSRTRRRV
jgi:hypothetical protein